MYSLTTTLLVVVLFMMQTAVAQRRRLWNFKSVAHKTIGRLCFGNMTDKSGDNYHFGKAEVLFQDNGKETSFTFRTVKARNSLFSAAKYGTPAMAGVGAGMSIVSAPTVATAAMIGGGGVASVAAAIGRAIKGKDKRWNETKYTYTFRLQREGRKHPRVLVKLEQCDKNMFGYKQEPKFAALKMVTAPDQSTFNNTPRVKFVFKTLGVQTVCDRWIYYGVGKDGKENIKNIKEDKTDEMKRIMRTFLEKAQNIESKGSKLKLYVKNTTEDESMWGKWINKSGTTRFVPFYGGYKKNCVELNKKAIDKYLEKLESSKVARVQRLKDEMKKIQEQLASLTQ